jgi:hypothetical protein
MGAKQLDHGIGNTFVSVGVTSAFCIVVPCVPRSSTNSQMAFLHFHNTSRFPALFTILWLPKTPSVETQRFRAFASNPFAASRW